MECVYSGNNAKSFKRNNVFTSDPATHADNVISNPTVNRLIMFWGAMLLSPCDPDYDASLWRWKTGHNTSCSLKCSSPQNLLSLQEEEERTGAKPATNQLVLNEVHSDQPKHHHTEKLGPTYNQCLVQLFFFRASYRGKSSLYVSFTAT